MQVSIISMWKLPKDIEICIDIAVTNFPKLIETYRDVEKTFKNCLLLYIGADFTSVFQAILLLFLTVTC